MATENMMFPLPKVRAYRAYFSEVRSAAKGTPDFNDLDTTVKICDQLISVMIAAEGDSSKRKPAKKTGTDDSAKA